MASPRPVPPYLRVMEVSAWVKGSKISAELVGSDPHTGVRDLETDDRVGAGGLVGGDPNGDLTGLGELDGVAGEVGEHLAQAVRVADHHRRDRVVEERDQLELLGSGGPRQQVDHFVDDRA